MTKPDLRPRIGPFSFDPEAGRLTHDDGREVTLRPQTAEVLAALVARGGELVTKAELMEEVWKDTHVTDDSLVQCVSEIRKALGPDDGGRLRTVPKQGYRLEAAAGPAGVGERPARPTRRLTVLALAACLVAAALLGALWAARAPAPASPRTVAVLPFVNMSEEAGRDYFSDGLAEDLLTDLSKLSDLTVLSRASTFAYRDRARGLQTIAGELGASHLVDGSVRREGDRVRISVQLVDAGSGASLWAERYDREMGDLFELQDELRGRIIGALAVRLAPEEAKRLAAGRTRAVAAYDLMLRGRHAEAALDRDGVGRAIGFYEAAIAADPGYGDAYARLANMYDIAARQGWSDAAGATRERSLEMAETAVRLDPQNAFAHWTLGRVLSRLDDPARQAAGLASLERAIALDPNYADAYAFIALVYIGDGKPGEARAAIDRASRLNPDGPSWYAQNRGIIGYMEGNFGAAVADFERAVDKNPSAPFTRLWLAAAYARAGRQDDAEWQVEEAFALGAPDHVSQVVAANAVIRDPDYRAAYVEGLLKAGLPM